MNRKFEKKNGNKRLCEKKCSKSNSRSIVVSSIRNIEMGFREIDLVSSLRASKTVNIWTWYCMQLVFCSQQLNYFSLSLSLHICFIVFLLSFLKWFLCIVQVRYGKVPQFKWIHPLQQKFFANLQLRRRAHAALCGVACNVYKKILWI